MGGPGIDRRCAGSTSRSLRSAPRPLEPVQSAGGAGQRRRPESVVPASMRGSTPGRRARAGNHTAPPPVSRSQYEKVSVWTRPSSRPGQGLVFGSDSFVTVWPAHLPSRRLPGYRRPPSETAPEADRRCAKEANRVGRTHDPQSLSRRTDGVLIRARLVVPRGRQGGERQRPRHDPGLMDEVT